MVIFLLKEEFSIFEKGSGIEKLVSIKWRPTGCLVKVLNDVNYKCLFGQIGVAGPGCV